MASVQVLKKQEHLEAGRRKLEEFRRKKAAEKAKKTNSTGQQNAVNDVPNEHQTLEAEQVRVTDSSSVSTSNAHVEGGQLGTIGGISDDTSEQLNSFSINLGSSSNKDIKRKNESASSFQELAHLKGEEIKDKSKTGKEIFQNGNDYDVSSAQVTLETGNDKYLPEQVSTSQEKHAPNRWSSHRLNDYSLNTITPEKILPTVNSELSTVFATEIVSKSSVSSLLANRFGNSGHLDNHQTSPYLGSIHSSTNITNSGFEFQERASPFSDRKEKNSNVDVSQTSTSESSPWAYDRGYAYSISGAQISQNHAPSSPPAAARRSRPSFLDSIEISRGPSPSLAPPLFVSAKADSSGSTVHPVDVIGPSVSQISANSSNGEGIAQLNHVMEEKHVFLSRKPNEDFTALEQHIEDLTQEKFSLQRALEASRALTESLASENSALTDSFNQQGGVVNQMKYDMERLQEEIKAQVVQLEAVQIEYANAQMECNAADERSKLLASEVIELEEKALRLRSNELKLERQLEAAEAEISSYRKKLSSLEKDRQDLQSTVAALKEEKKMLQSKLRKASSSGKSVDLSRITEDKKDVSTSTEDLDVNKPEASSSENLGSPLPGDDALSLENLAVALPSDQIRTIQNINALIAELALEKEQLVQALAAESSQSSKLSDLNKELSHKLEAQTQRLELLTARNMANDRTQLKQSDTPIRIESARYADEGDEVVERVLGWIMKLFPGGPSRQRTTKHH